MLVKEERESKEDKTIKKEEDEEKNVCKITVTTRKRRNIGRKIESCKEKKENRDMKGTMMIRSRRKEMKRSRREKYQKEDRKL